ncbi:MAG TPA: methyltransferase domain-containing protein [Thermodesulfobacteriota bacterium]|nr:methyltransferase domain-containing protein [Thermodesulfobacteriota bacterium]
MADYSKIRCPICKGGLDAADDLRCSRCNITYPVKRGIPIMLPNLDDVDSEQNLAAEKEFYENMFSDLKGLDDGHCIVYGHERIYDFMDRVERGTVLEAGCGGGHHSVSLSKKGFKVTSVDLSFNGLLQAKRLAQHESQDILHLCGDIKRLPFEDNAFDICFCSLILHHFTSLDNIIAELCRVTRRYFVAFEVNALDPISFLRFNVLNPVFGIKNISKNQRALFPDRLAKTLNRNGFTDTVISYEDMHEYLGKAPESLKGRMLAGYLKLMKIFPEKYSRNKFLLLAEKKRRG